MFVHSSRYCCPLSHLSKRAFKISSASSFRKGIHIDYYTIMSLLRPSKERLLEVLKLSKSIFRETFNPTNARTGAKVLRQRLKGDLIRSYYKPNFPELTLRYMNKQLRPPGSYYVHYDPVEERRVEKIAA